MGLIKCKECQNSISKKAKSCSHCGAPGKRRTSAFTWLVAITLAPGIIVTAAIAPSGQEPAKTDSKPTIERAAMPATTAGEREIHAKEFGDQWPFVVRQGVIKCERIRPAGYTGVPIEIVTFKAPGLNKTFALNGMASSRGYERPDDIWLDAEPPGGKMDIAVLIEAGLSLCAP